MKQAQETDTGERRGPGAGVGTGLAHWLLKSLRKNRSREPRLELLERIALAPRQSLALVEAEGRRFLVATSADGGPAFYALDTRPPRTGRRSPRVSW